MEDTNEEDTLSSCRICQHDPHGQDFMLSCDSCGEWFHGACVKVTQLEAEAMVSNNLKFACPSCKGMDKKQENHCPICLHSSPSINAMWQHINCVHASRSEFPPIQQYHNDNRLICSVCHWAYHKRFIRQGCQRQLLDSRCGNPLVDPMDMPSLTFPVVNLDPHSPEALQRDPQRESSSVSPDEDMLLHLALQAVETLQFDKDYSSFEADSFNALLSKCMTLSTPTVKHVPRSCRPLLAQLLAKEFQHARRANIWGFARVFLFPKLTLSSPPRRKKKRRDIPRAVILNHLTAWKRDRIYDLWSEAISKQNQATKQYSGNSSTQTNIHRALTLGREGHYSKAVQALGSLGVASPDSPTALQELIVRHPLGALPLEVTDIPSNLSVSCLQVSTAITRFPKGSSPGASQLRAQHLYDAICGTTVPAAQDCLSALTKWINLLLSGKANPIIAPWLCGAPLTALIKKGGGVRPIAVGETIRRLTSRLCCSAVFPSLPDTFIPEGQVGVGVKRGLEAAIHGTRYIVNQHQSKTNFCLLKVDFSNAFNECDRNTFFNRVRDDFPELLGWVHWCYSQPAQLRFGEHTILSTSGVQQGDPLGPLLFSLTLSELLRTIKISADIPLNVWYLDDGTLIGPRPMVAEVLSSIETHGHRFGLFLNRSKCEVYWPSGDPTFSEFPEEVTRLRSGVSLLGSPIWGTMEYMKNSIKCPIDKVSVVQQQLLELEDPQVELHLLRSCLGVCKVNHLLRTVPRYHMETDLADFDANLRSSLSKISRTTISDDAWRQASLPFRLGGLGLRQAHTTAPIAFLASCHASHSLVKQLLGMDPGQELCLIGEEEAHVTLTNKHCLQLDNLTQFHLQAQVEEKCYEELLSSYDVRNQARLRAISESTEPSAWLRAAPISSLGLSMRSSEFVVSIRIWLGIPFFLETSSNALCTCKTPIDAHGDHLLGCGFGPLRIRRHDALCEVIWHALQQDNPNARREQRVSGESQARPGDIYHPDYSNGYPTFFDISVRNTLQPSVINRAASSAGVAASEGEAQKDQKHKALVEEAGAIFTPLVTETLGVWSPFAKATLKNIAARSTVRNGLSPSTAYQNLMQQLSIKLFSYNAKMILNHLQIVQDDLWDVPLV